MAPTEVVVKEGFFGRILSRIERAGNKLPDPISLFVILAVAVLLKKNQDIAELFRAKEAESQLKLRGASRPPRASLRI